jgi:hypothetical protein
MAGGSRHPRFLFPRATAPTFGPLPFQNTGIKYSISESLAAG